MNAYKQHFLLILLSDNIKFNNKKPIKPMGYLSLSSLYLIILYIIYTFNHNVSKLRNGIASDCKSDGLLPLVVRFHPWIHIRSCMNDIQEWCNGNTNDSKSFIEGSNPSSCE